MSLHASLEKIFGRIEINSQVRVGKRRKTNKGGDFDEGVEALQQKKEENRQLYARSDWRVTFDRLRSAASLPDGGASLMNGDEDEEDSYGCVASRFPVECAREMVERGAEEVGDECVEAERREELAKEADAHWDRFYAVHAEGFFQERRWMWREIPVLDPKRAPKMWESFLEVGCGTGSTMFSLAKWFPDARVVGCDFAPTAISTLRARPDFDAARMDAFVADISKPNALSGRSAEVATAIFALSAMPPEDQSVAVSNLAAAVKPGGFVCIRDYAVYDMTQLRFICKGGRKLADRLYAREDGTRTYFFETAEVDRLFSSAGFSGTSEYVSTGLRNRKSGDVMYRVFIQGTYQRTT